MSKFKTINPSVHTICGKCGCNNMFEYEISNDVDDSTDEPIQIVYLICRNCSTLTGLDELMEKYDKK